MPIDGSMALQISNNNIDYDNDYSIIEWVNEKGFSQNKNEWYFWFIS